MKKIANNEYFSVLKELVEEGKEVSLLVSGNSMFPFLVNERDYILFRKPTENLKKGDMVFYQRLDGQFVMHRICSVKKEGFYIIGDGQYSIEGPVMREQIFAIITKVKRNGKWIKSGNLTWVFFQYIWINIIPIRSKIIRIYNLFKS